MHSVLPTLRELIDACIAAKTGDKQFALFGDNDGYWRAEIGNPANVVSLGEAEGEFRGQGSTPEEAVASLLAELPRA